LTEFWIFGTGELKLAFCGRRHVFGADFSYAIRVREKPQFAGVRGMANTAKFRFTAFYEVRLEGVLESGNS
jgi:hypothetical protein